MGRDSFPSLSRVLQALSNVSGTPWDGEQWE